MLSRGSSGRLRRQRPVAQGNGPRADAKPETDRAAQNAGRSRAAGGIGRHGTIGHGPSGYLKLGRALDDFDLVYAFPWTGEEPMMLDLMRCHGRQDAHLLLYTAQDGVRLYRGGNRMSMGSAT